MKTVGFLLLFVGPLNIFAQDGSVANQRSNVSKINSLLARNSSPYPIDRGRLPYNDILRKTSNVYHDSTSQSKQMRSIDPRTKDFPYIDYLPLTAGSSYPLTGTLFGTQAVFTDKLGLGTSTPRSSIHILGSGSSAYSVANGLSVGGVVNGGEYIGLEVVNTKTATSGSLNESSSLLLSFNDDANGTANAVKLSAGKDNDYTPTAADNDAFFAIHVANDNVYQERLRITSGGKIGMGTTSPKSRLHILGSGSSAYSVASGLSVGGAVDGEYIGMEVVNTQTSTSGSLNETSALLLSFNDDAGGTASAVKLLAGKENDYTPAASDNDAYFAVHVTNNNVYEEKFRVTSGGNVGIGTAIPSEKLSVNGNIKAKKVMVSQTDWSDYVFAKDYKLISIAEVEKFIKANRHLPDMPSAKEVEEKGISVGDNQALLLKKIEELTLYVIQQQKEINKLKKTLKNKKW